MNQANAHWITSAVAAYIVASGTFAQRPYEGDIVIRATLDTVAEVEQILEISPDPWSHRIAIGEADFRIPAGARAALDASGIDYVVLDADLQATIDAGAARLATRTGAFYDNYQPMSAISAQMDAIVTLRPDLATRFTVGQSFELRNIDALHIGAAGVDKPALLVQATQHAREWIAPMTAVYLAERLVTEYDTDPEVQRLLDAVDIFIVPVVNPDGYVYSWDSVRLWRKNRRDNPGTSNEGVDLNRNWGVGFGGPFSSSFPGSDLFKGTAPFSEPETAAMKAFVEANPQIRAMFDVHTYGQLILSPPGYTTNPTPHPDDITLASLTTALDDAVFAVNGLDYVDGAAGPDQYLAGGDSPDWHYFRTQANADNGTRAADALLSWTFEMRPATAGQGGFDPSPTLIRPSCEELYAAALVAADMTLRSTDITLLTTLPSELLPDTPFGVSAAVYPLPGFDLAGPLSVDLMTRIDGGPWNPAPVTPMPGDLFDADLPAAPAGSTIDFYFAATADGGPANTLPILGPDEPFSIRVDDPADLNDDGVVDGADLGLLLGDWGAPGGASDLNGDGAVDGADLGLLLGAWSS